MNNYDLYDDYNDFFFMYIRTYYLPLQFVCRNLCILSDMLLRYMFLRMTLMIAQSLSVAKTSGLYLFLLYTTNIFIVYRIDFI